MAGVGGAGPRQTQRRCRSTSFHVWAGQLRVETGAPSLPPIVHANQVHDGGMRRSSITGGRPGPAQTAPACLAVRAFPVPICLLA